MVYPGHSYREDTKSGTCSGSKGYFVRTKIISLFENFSENISCTELNIFSFIENFCLLSNIKRI
jgi:hypothetical protein